MPTDILALPSSSLNTKWKEPYASASLNQRFVGITAPGIYRGLRLQPDLSLGERTILVQADQDRLDHVAVYENASGFSVTYRDSTSGDITLSLAAYSSINVVVCIFVNYQTGISTTGAFRVFTEAEFNALSSDIRNALVVLGTVTVPASGSIPLANISLLRRTLASTNLSRGTILNSPLIRNPGFESGETNATHAKSSLFWDKSMTVGTGTWKTSTTQVSTGMKSIELNVTAGPVTGDLSQQIGVETAVDELFLISVSVKQLKTISSGSFVFFVEWSDVNDAVLTTTTITLDGGAIDSTFRTVELFVTAPAGAASIRAVGVRATALSPSTTGVFGYIDNIDVLMEPRDTRHPYPFDQAYRRSLSASGIDLVDKAGNFAGLHAGVRFDQSTPVSEGRVVIEPGDPADLPPALALLGRIHKLGAGLLNTNANSLKPRISWDNGESVQRTLLWESAGDASGIPTLRQYVDSGGKAQLTANARFDGTNWNKDINGQEAFSFTISKFGVVQAYQISGTNSWVDVAWVPAFDLTSSGINTDLLMVANKHVKVQGTGRHKHGTRTINIPAIAGQFANGFGTPTVFRTGSGGFDVTSGAFPPYDVPCVIEVGKRITGVRFRVLDNTTGPTRFACNFVECIDFGATGIGFGFSNVLSTGSGVLQTLSLPGPIATTVVSGRTYIGTVSTFTGTAPCYFFWMEVDYDDL